MSILHIILHPSARKCKLLLITLLDIRWLHLAFHQPITVLTGQQNIRPLRGYHFNPWLITVKTWELSNQLISDLNRISMWMCW